MLNNTFEQIYSDIDKLIYISRNTSVYNDNEVIVTKRRLLENIKAIELLTIQKEDHT